ncbi:MAG: DUF1275 domain-containing protein [Gammaproteobacteria bacterium]|nr:MAG: DUF1275 domain-containing protein [Gammaproteobacteria bacterium]
MINKLPRWVEFGGFCLAFIAGSINSVGLLGFKHQAVSHLTGTSTFLSLEIASLNVTEVTHLLSLALSFLMGAVLSGFIVGNTALKLGRRYSFALFIESLFLFIAFLLLNNNSLHGYYFASAACGLQNALTSTYSGAVIRTTHVSGLFTDIGIMIGLRFRGQATDKRKIILYIILILGFIFGGIVGALSFKVFAFEAILLPCILSLAIAVGYWFYLRIKNS